MFAKGHLISFEKWDSKKHQFIRSDINKELIILDEKNDNNIQFMCII